jgi:hypothetical protein
VSGHDRIAPQDETAEVLWAIYAPYLLARTNFWLNQNCIEVSNGGTARKIDRPVSSARVQMAL